MTGELAVALGIRPSKIVREGSIQDLVFDYIVVNDALERMKTESRD